MARIGTIVRTIVYICPNKYGIHSEPYYPYILFIDNHGYAMFIDDPDYETCQKILTQIEISGRPVDEQSGAVYHSCQWCKSLEADELKGG